MPYNDMISWALENVDVQTRSIYNYQKVVFGSFRPEHIQVMYKINIITMLHSCWSLSNMNAYNMTKVILIYSSSGGGTQRKSWNPTNTEPIHFYHSKLWKDKVKYLFYEIFHHVVVPVHIALYDFPPSRISNRIMGNVDKIANWFIKGNFSYIRVLRCSVPPMLSRYFYQAN
jgi:hypothetical protein